MSSRDSITWKVAIGIVLATVVPGLFLENDPTSACGPNFPNRLLLMGDHPLLRAPTVRFRGEVDSILPQEPPRFLSVAAKVAEKPAELTSRLGALDLDAALQNRGVATPKRAQLIESYRALRQHLAAPETRSQLVVPDGLPTEFDDYLRGALAFHRKDHEGARRYWEALLARPQAERRYRTVWATFMLGKLAMRSSPDDAVERFRATRQLVRDGYRDRLGLAASSLGWEAKVELERGRYERAIELYLEHHYSGDRTAIASLQASMARLLKAGPEALRRAARHGATRRLVSFRVAASYSARTRDEARAWLEALAAAGVTDAEGADLLALAAYRRGDMETAAEWLDRSAESALVLWLRAKLLLRRGAVDDAALLLARVCRQFPSDEDWKRDTLSSADHHDRTAWARALGELGVLRLARRQYVEALDALLRSRNWMDAAYVAERVLTPDELIAYVDRHWQRSPEKLEKWVQARSSPRGSIRYLLARRLARHGRFEEATRYLPGDLQPQLASYRSAIDTGNARRGARADRGRAFWSAARIARHQGMELFGTEVEPDWSLWGGSHDLHYYENERRERGSGDIVSVSEDEMRRVERHGVDPLKRFHYRYRAVEHAWAASQFLEDGSEELARLLCIAGSWIKGRDPKAADRFYKALVRRCGNTRLGREADRLRWFPVVKAQVVNE